MNYDSLLSMVGDYGYFAVFFALWLGIIGIPIPDELVVMTGGAVTASGLLHPLPTFILTYLGVVSGLSLGYVLGRFMGHPAMEWLKRKKNMEKYLDISEKWFRKYGSAALVISYFFPVIRHVMPYVSGINRMTFVRYSLLSYSTGLAWTFMYFMLGRLFGNHVDDAGIFISTYGQKALWLLIVFISVIAIVRANPRRWLG